MKKKSVMVVLSGGQDSTTCLLEARARYDEVHAITFNYGQRHQRELSCAVEIGKIVGVDTHDVVDVKGLLRGRSPLVNPSAELETYTDHASMEAIIGNRVELTFVPLRNPLFLLVAANYALARDCYTLMTGVCQMDNANYPDCTAEFIMATENMMNQALGFNDAGYTGQRMVIEAPLLFLSKADTARMAMLHGTIGYWALAASHTCYAGEYPPCGKCHACVLRAEGFDQAGMGDPLVIESTKMEG